MNRRQLLTALGLGALFRPASSRAQSMSFPTRVVFFVQPHGHVPSGWKMNVPAPQGALFAERAFTGLAEADFSEVLRPLVPFRDKVLAIEGLAHTSALEDIAHLRRDGGDANNHNVAVADLLSCSRADQHPGFPCTGGAITIDQLLGQRTMGGGRFASRVYGGDYVPNQVVAPFSFTGPSQPTPVVKNPATAFLDLTGRPLPTEERTQKLARARVSMLDSVADEYAAVARTLGREGQATLEAHRDLVRDLERSLSMAPQCSGSLDGSLHTARQFMQLIRMAFACDLTRVMTFAPSPAPCSEFGYPPNNDVHANYAHAAISGATSCGQTYSPIAERAMTDFSLWHARHLAFLLEQLDSVREGDGTLLDHTIVVWLTELGTPTHRHDDAFTVLIGGGNGFLRTGRYVRYAPRFDNPVTGSPTEWPRIGPAHSKLFVSLLRAMGQNDTSFGTTSATSSSGEAIDLTGPLTELHR